MEIKHDSRENSDGELNQMVDKNSSDSEGSGSHIDEDEENEVQVYYEKDEIEATNAV